MHMCSCTNNISRLTFVIIIYTKSQQSIIQDFIPFYCVDRFRKSMTLFLLVDHNTLKDAKNVIFNIITVVAHNENIGEYP